MIIEGCEFEHKTKKNVRGVVEEISGNTAYVMLENGCTDEYQVSDLLNLTEIQKQKDFVSFLVMKEQEEKFPRFDELWTALKKEKFDIICSKLYARIGAGVTLLGGSAPEFEKLGNYQKMNFIQVVLKTTYEKLLEILDETPDRFPIIIRLMLANDTVMGMMGVRIS